MMIFIVISILFAVLLAFSIGFRTRIVNLVRGAGLYAAGSWNMMWPVVRRTFIRGLFVGLSGWLLLIVLMIGLGIYANSIISALIISLIFPFWFILMLIPRISSAPAVAGATVRRWRIPILGISRSLLTIVIFLASANLLIGLWSPEFKDALDERNEDGKTSAANFLTKGSAQSERNAGSKARIKAKTGSYDDFGKATKKIVEAGETVMVINPKVKPATNNREALIQVMRRNEYGNFVDGEKVWVPSLMVKFINNQEEAEKLEAKAEKSEPLPATETPTPPPQPQVTSNGPGKNPVEFFYDTASLRRAGMEKVATLEPGRYRFTMTGEGEFQNGQCTPRFTSQKCGEIFIFAGDQFAFPGDQLNLESQEHLFVKINSHERSGRTGMVKIRIEKIG